MKKILSVLIVLSLLTATVFAASPVISGNFGYGYLFNFDGTSQAYNALGDSGNTNSGYLYLKTSTDYVDVDLRASTVRAGIEATGTLKLSELINNVFETELPVTLNAYVGNQSPSAKDTFAYTRPGSGDDEISLNADRADMPIGLSIAYNNLVTVNAYANIIGTESISGKAGLVEVLATPVDGVNLQVAYGISQNQDMLQTKAGENLGYLSDFQTAALVDIASLANLDFSLDVSGYMEANLAHFTDTLVAKGAVTGGYDAFGLYAEYTYKAKDAYTDSDTYAGHTLYFGGSYDIASEKAPLTLGVGTSIKNLSTSATVGASAYADTTIGGVEFYTEVGVDDFTDVKTGYVCVASAISF